MQYSAWDMISFNFFTGTLPMIENPNSLRTRSKKTPRILLRSQIEEAQLHTNSNMAAARWLNVDYDFYKKYAKLYNLFDRHLNEKGKGIEKGFAKRPTSIPLRDVLAGKHPNYPLTKLKNRLLARNKLVEACALCGFNEGRITDGRVPLILTFKDDNRTNFTLSNLELRCYNCSFLTIGKSKLVNKAIHIERSFMKPDSIPKASTLPQTAADYYDPIDEYQDIELSEEEKEHLLADIHQHLE